jgi:hypothetical protein
VRRWIAGKCVRRYCCRHAAGNRIPDTPRIDSWMKSWPIASSPRACSIAITAQVPVPHGDLKGVRRVGGPAELRRGSPPSPAVPPEFVTLFFTWNFFPS